MDSNVILRINHITYKTGYRIMKALDENGFDAYLSDAPEDENLAMVTVKFHTGTYAVVKINPQTPRKVKVDILAERLDKEGFPYSQVIFTITLKKEDFTTIEFH